MTKFANFAENDAIENALNAAQVVFSLNPAMAPQTKHFQATQNQFLKETEKFYAAWLKRRDTATRAAFDTANQFAKAGMKNPADAMSVLLGWQTHAMERLVDDARDYADLMTSCVNCAINNEIEVAQETAENYKRATTHTAIPV